MCTNKSNVQKTCFAAQCVFCLLNCSSYWKYPSGHYLYLVHSKLTFRIRFFSSPRREWATQWLQKSCTSLCAMLMIGLLQVLSKPGVFVFVFVFVFVWWWQHTMQQDCYKLKFNCLKPNEDCLVWLFLNQCSSWNDPGWSPPLLCLQLFHALSTLRWSRCLNQFWQEGLRVQFSSS